MAAETSDARALILLGSSWKDSTAALKKTSWNLERAVDAHFASGRPSPTPAPAKTDVSKLNTIFTKYAGTTERDKDLMFEEKLGDFFKAIGLDPAAGSTLGVAWKLKCKTIGQIERKEFCDGFLALGADTLPAITTQARAIASSLDNAREFKEFYRWLFDFVKEEGERKTIDAQVAMDMWNLTFTKHFPLLPKWIQFLTDKASKTVSKDVWLQLYDFAKDVKPDLSNYDADGGSWPSLIDEFVTHVKAGGGGAAADRKEAKRDD